MRRQLVASMAQQRLTGGALEAFTIAPEDVASRLAEAARHQAGDPSFKEINEVHQNALRAAALVSQLLAFSRKQTMQPKVLALISTRIP